MDPESTNTTRRNNTGHGTTCSHILEALLQALQRGELPALLSLTFTCLSVSNREAWRQNEVNPLVFIIHFDGSVWISFDYLFPRHNPL